VPLFIASVRERLSGVHTVLQVRTLIVQSMVARHDVKNKILSGRLKISRAAYK
jgi:archaellum biogenesis ATPase FlaH